VLARQGMEKEGISIDILRSSSGKEQMDAHEIVGRAPMQLGVDILNFNMVDMENKEFRIQNNPIALENYVYELIDDCTRTERKFKSIISMDGITITTRRNSMCTLLYLVTDHFQRPPTSSSV